MTNPCRTPPQGDPDSSPLTLTPTTPRSLIQFANETECLLSEEQQRVSVGTCKTACAGKYQKEKY